MPPALIRVAAATLQVGLGLLAVLGAASTASLIGDPGLDTRRARLVAVDLLLGGTLFLVWVLARRRRLWLCVLGGMTAVLAVLAGAAAVHQIRPVRGTPDGLWTGIWTPVADAALWLLVAIGALVELRQLRRLGDARPQGWPYAVAVAAPLALVVALPVLAVSRAPAAMVRVNSEVTAAKPAGPQQESELSGRIRWETTLAATNDVVVTRSGLAVPVERIGEESAGVLMLDPSTGATLWRYQLHGLTRPPQLAVTDEGRSVLLTFDESDLADGIPDQRFTLDAATGQVRAFWPKSGEVIDTDPPVLFDHVPQGANSVIAISPAGKKLWRYRPESCADPRGVESTPSVMVVNARQCGQASGSQILGLDGRTGKRRWTQPAENDSADEAVVLDAGHRLELGKDSLRDRRLDTGALAWTTPTASFCHERSGIPSGRSLVTATQTAFVGCGDPTDAGPNALTAFSTASGAQLWQRKGLARIISVAAVDARQALVLTKGTKTCDVELVAASGSTLRWSVPDDDASSSADNTNCEGSTMVRAGDTFLLVLQLRNSDQPGRVHYRIVALA